MTTNHNPVMPQTPVDSVYISDSLGADNGSFIT